MKLLLGSKVVRETSSALLKTGLRFGRAESIPTVLQHPSAQRELVAQILPFQVFLPLLLVHDLPRLMCA